MLGHPCSKIHLDSFARLAAVARRSRCSKGVDCGELDDVGSGLTTSTVAEGPLESVVKSRGRLSDGNLLVDVPDDVDM